MKWINALGLILQFLSFWLAAPELLGEATLRRFEKGLKKLLATLPLIIVFTIIGAYGLSFSILGITKGIEGGQNGTTNYRSFFITLAICTAVYFVFILFYKRIRHWLDVKLAQPLIEKLVHNNEVRRQALIAGAVLFTIGFLVQLAVIITS